MSNFKKEIQNKIINDLLLNPLSLCLGVVGASGLILAWAVGWSLITFLSGLSLLGSIGWAATNVVLNYESVASRIIDEHKKQSEVARELALDALDKKLRTDRDPRDQTALRDLRAAFKALKDDVAAGRADCVTPQILKQYQDLFDRCVLSLHHQFELYLRSTKARGAVKERLRADREIELASVVKTVEWFVNSVAALGQKNEVVKLDEQLRRELDQNLEIAKKVDEEMSQLDLSVEERYKEFLK